MSLLVPAGQLGRANGLQSLGEGAATLVAPISAGLLVPTIGISGTIVIDLATFVFSAVILVFLKIPNPVVSAERQQKNKQNSVLEDIKVDWEFIRMQRGLINLLSVGTAQGQLTSRGQGGSSTVDSGTDRPSRHVFYFSRSRQLSPLCASG